MNGNKFKGNKSKKERRRRNPDAEYDSDNDRYAKIINLHGDCRVTVEPVDSDEKVILCASIPGKFKKKVWFNRGDYVVINQVVDNKWMVKGKINQKELKKIINMFDKKNNNDDLGVIKFTGDESESNSEEKEVNDKHNNKKKQKIAPQPERNFDIIDSSSDEKSDEKNDEKNDEKSDEIDLDKL